MNRMGGSLKGLLVIAVLATTGCATLGVGASGPADIPELQRRVEVEPDNGRLHLALAAAQAEVGRCDRAVILARRGRTLLPADPAGPLVLGQCLEEAGEYGNALNLYAQFIFDHGDAPGAGAVEGRRMVALQAQARQMAQSAVENELILAPAEPETVGILPFVVDGAEAYQPLSVGLAHMLTTDLALLRRFPLVERVQLDALLQELELAPELIDPATAARTGRLMRASRMILGTVSVPSDAEARLGGSIVLETGEVAEPLAMEGALEDILSLEKELAINIAESLGYQLSEAERQRILENRPGSLAAFLSFSRGLLAEGLGEYDAAAAFYGAALSSDPNYGEAQTKLRETSGVEEGRNQLAQLSDPGPSQADAARSELMANTMANAMAGSMMDVATHLVERVTIDAGTSGTLSTVLLSENQILPLLEGIIIITIRISR